MKRLFALPFLALAANASAEDTHYQDQIVGEDALGMGGAFTAVADDASAAFYNPAGLAQIRSGSLSGSLSVYGYESRRLENGLQSSVGNPGDCHANPGPPPPDNICARDFTHEDYPTRAIGGGVVKRFGKRGPDRQRPFAFAFSTYVPFQSSYTYRVAYRVDNPYPGYPVLYSDRTITISEDDKTIWVGPSLAYRVNADLAFGLSGFLSTRTLTRNYDESQVDAIASPDPYAPQGAVVADYANIITTSMDVTALTVVLRFGALWTPGDRVRLGLMVAPPSIPVTGEGSVRNRSLVGTSPPTYDRSNFHGLAVHAALPAHGRLGLAYVVNETTLVALDGSLWLPLSYTDDEPFVEQAPVFTDNYFVRIYDRNLTANLNAGFEAMLFETVPFRFGVLTNLSSAPPPVAGTVRMQPDVDMYGVSAAVGFRDEGYDISVGAAFMRGFEGRALAYRQPDVSTDQPYSVERYEQTAVYLYLAGAKKAAGRAVREFMKP